MQILVFGPWNKQMGKHRAYTYLHLPNSKAHTHTNWSSAVWLINSFLCLGGVMTADSSESPEDQRVTPLINCARWNVKHWIWSSLSLSLSLSIFLFLFLFPMRNGFSSFSLSDSRCLSELLSLHLSGIFFLRMPLSDSESSLSLTYLWIPISLPLSSSPSRNLSLSER